MIDTIVRGGTLVRPDGRVKADIRMSEGRIVEIAPDLTGARAHEIDATGLHVFPGLIDAHLHFNEPGRTEWEGAETGSHALAAGGGTLFFDMPLNSTPCTMTAEAVDAKRAALEASSVTDFGLWGGLVPGSVDQMAAMAERGVVGFKAFMCDSGLAEFRVRRRQDASRRHARGGAPRPAGGRPRRERGDDASARRAHDRIDRAAIFSRRALSRPSSTRSRAPSISRARPARSFTSCMSAPAAASRKQPRDARAAWTCRWRRVRTTCFSRRRISRPSASPSKCAPPLRHPDEHAMLWGEVLDGRVDLIASDHSPCRAVAEEVAGDFRASWGGVAGVQSTLAVLLERGLDGRRLRFEQISALDRGQPGGAVSNPVERHAGSRKRRRSAAARSVAFVYAGRGAPAPAA